MSERTSRRALVYGIGVATTAGLLAGCTTETRDGGDGGDGGGDGDGGDGGDGGDAGDGGDSGDGGTPTSGDDGGDGGTGTVPSALADYMSDANNYDGTVADETGTESPTVMVGAGNGLAFGPAAIRVSTGTTVTWEWTGQGGAHNVVAESGADFRSGDPTSGGGTTFSHTFDSAGVVTYYCNPHSSLGMRGAVVVE